jgi:ketosteroid isomerase-like protein
MKRLLLALALLAQLAACETTRVSVRDLDQTRVRALVQNDLKQLDALLADDLVYVHADAGVESKSEFLNRLRSGSLRYRSIEPADVRVRMYGNTAVVTGRSHMAVTNAGADREFVVRYTAVYAASSGRWQLVSWQTTRIPQ